MALPRGAVTRDELRQVARVWQTVFDSRELSMQLGARREALQGTFDVSVLAARMERDIVQLLAGYWRDSLADRVEDEDEPLLILAAKDHLQSELLGELEASCATLPRGKARSSDDFEQHWRAWARVRSLAQLFLDALPDRRNMIFDTVGLDLLNHGAWLFNTERARVLAHDVFRFLSTLTPPDSNNRRVIRQNMDLSR